MCIGYKNWTTKKGVSKCTWVISHDKLLDIWEKSQTYISIRDELKRDDNLPPRWNKHDQTVIDGFEKHIRPFNMPDGNMLDPTEDQLQKYYKAIKKLQEHLTEETYNLEDFLDDLNLEPPQFELDNADLKGHMDERRMLERKLKLLR